MITWPRPSKQTKASICVRQQALQRLTEAAEKAKVELSNATQSEINLPFITATPEGLKHRLPSPRQVRGTGLQADRLLRHACGAGAKDAKLSSGELDEIVMVGGSTRIPAVLELVKRITGKDPNQTVNPDEVVAVGAAIQGGVLAGEVKDILCSTSRLSPWVETLGGVMTKMITRNTTVPTKKTETYSTADGQTNVEIHVLQGEREMASDNKSLGTFRLDGIPPAPRGSSDRSDFRHRCQRHPQRHRQGQGQWQGAVHHRCVDLSDSEVDKTVKDAETMRARQGEALRRST